ncbi:MAG: response regulator RpfG family c-di-GMP phosphodiesterase [Candidatus Latescibacterota bacterium]|jgi:response regulator RpfG family c-di-GMP phosphodiesterase
MAKQRILFVDDEPDLLEGVQRMLFRERKRWDMHFAQSGDEGLSAIAKQPFNVVVADMRMPQMDGVQFLQQVSEKSRDTVRMMLTGNTDQETAMKAVNDGNVFRFMTKPVERETLIQMLESGIEQHRLITAEKELLTGTLAGSVRMLTEILSVATPDSFGHAMWLRDQMRDISRSLKLRNAWELVIAATLSRVGYATLPSELVKRALDQHELSKEERDIISRLPQISHDILRHIPRLEGAAKIVLYQEKNFDGSGFPDDAIAEAEIPLGARIIRILNDLAHLSKTELSKYKLTKVIKERRGWYDPNLLDQLLPLFVSPNAAELAGSAENSESIPLRKLRMGDKLVGNIVSLDGQTIVAAGNRISPTFMQKIEVSASLKGIKEPIFIEKKLDGENSSA